MPHFWKPLRQALLAVTAIGLVACGEQMEPLSPEAEAPATVTVNGVQILTMAPGRKLAPAGDAVMVHPKDGATIASGDAKLIVQPGSVPNGTKITMEPLNNGYIEFKFGPSGLQFNPAATLTISAAKANIPGVDKHRLKIAVASDSQNDWQVVGGTYDPLTDTVTVSIDHFSRYALCIE